MAAQLSREVLQKVVDAANAVISALAGENEDVHKDDSTKMCHLWDELNDKYAPPEIVRGMARMLLAGMDCDPVAWTDEQELRDLEKSGCAYLFTVNPITPNADPRRVIRLYTAPPAPVAVPDVDPRDAFEVVFPIPKYAERCGAGYCCTAYSAWGAQDFIQKWNGWYACRAAMLKAGPVTAAAVPDGWKLVPVEPTMPQELAGHKTLSDTGKISRLMKTRISNIYRAMLAAAPAAPEQEV